MEFILQLECNGLIILSVEEVGGQYFDELIVSLGIGFVDYKGYLLKELQYLNSLVGVMLFIKLEECLMGVKKVYFFNFMLVDEIEG